MTTPTPPNPYVGPRTFERKDAQRFFGRETEARDLLALVGSQRLVLFYAQSGAGKSSLINTRLAPQLEARGLYVLPVGRVGGELPAGVAAVENIYLFNLMLSLDQGCDGRGGDPARLVGLSLGEFLHGLTSDDGQTWYYDPADASAEAGADDDYTAANTVLIVDQFEEIITTHADRWPERAGFFQQLDAAMQADPRLRVVLSLREDYVAALDPYAQHLADKLRARFYMERMGVDAALPAVQQPAADAGRPFAPGVAAQLVDDLRKVRVPGLAEPQVGQYVEPVQLQVVCYQLWENLAGATPSTSPDIVGADPRGRPTGQVQDLPLRNDQPAITFADLQAAGDVDSALAAFYETAIAQVVNRPELGVSEQQLRTWFSTKLITEAGTRGTVFRDERSGLTAGLPNAAVDVLARQFLLRTELRAGGAWVELVHDRFVAPILRANRARQTPLALDAEAWLAVGKDASRLYEGQKLKDAAAVIDQHPEQHSDAERAFVEAGQARQSARDARWRRIVTLATAGLVILFAVLAGAALWNAVQANQAAQQAESSRKTAEAKATEATVAQVVAAAAQQKAENERVAADAARAGAESARKEADAARAETERLTRGIRADQLTLQGLRAVKQSPRLALLLGVEGLRAQNDFTQTQPYTTTRISYAFEQAAYISENKVVTGAETVVGSAQTNMHVLLGSVGGLPLPGHAGEVLAVAFSPDGRWLATSSEDHTARLWDLTAADPGYDPIVLAGHVNSVLTAAFSLDSHWLATVSGRAFESDTPNVYDARLWNLTVADPAQDPIILVGHTGRIDAATFSPDSHWLATASQDLSARLWDLTAADPNQDPIVFTGHGGDVRAVAFSPDEQWLVTASDDATARLWNLTAATPNQDPIILTGHTGTINATAFSPDDHWLATASYDGTIRLWDLTAAVSTRDPTVLAGHTDIISALAFSPDGHWLATASYDDTARLWDLTGADPTQNPIVLTGHTAGINAAAFSPDSRRLVTASSDASARLWDLTADDPAMGSIVLIGHSGGINDAGFSTSGRWLATASSDGTARLWDLSTADPVVNPIVLIGHADSASATTFSPDGHWLATTSDNSIELWNVTAAPPFLEPVVLTGHVDKVSDVAFSPDGRRLASASSDGVIHLWNLVAANANVDSEILTSDAGSSADIMFSPNGQWLATLPLTSVPKLWNLTVSDPTQEPLILTGYNEGASVMAFSPDSRWLATNSRDHTARLWDLATTDAIKEPLVLAGHTDAVTSMAFSPDGHWLATGSGASLSVWNDSTVRLWDLTAAEPDQNPIVLRTNAGWTNALAFSPDGRWLVTLSNDLIGYWSESPIRLWEFSAAEPDQNPIVLQEQAGYIAAIAFTPDGRWLATASDDLVHLWDLTIAGPNQEPVALQGHGGAFDAVAFSPDGRWLATTSEDHTARLWRWRVDDLIALACRSAGRNLTVEEWRSYFPGNPYHQTCEQWQVHPSVAQALRNEARTLARQGDIAGAVARFEEAQRLAPTVPIDPMLLAQVDRGIGLLISGDYTDGMASLFAAQIISPAFNITYSLSTDEWNNVCWNGTLTGVATAILPACERAVALAPDDGAVRDSRGLARALTGDLNGAIMDFEFAVQWAKETSYHTAFIESRTAWIAALRAGENPFDAETLEQLRNE